MHSSGVPAIITVEVIGYGGPDEEDEKEEDPEPGVGEKGAEWEPRMPF